MNYPANLDTELSDIEELISDFSIEQLHAIVRLETGVRRTMDPLKVILVIEQILSDLGFRSEIYVQTSHDERSKHIPEKPNGQGMLRFHFQEYGAIAGDEFGVCIDLAPIDESREIEDNEKAFLDFFCRQVGTVLAHQWVFQNLARTQERLLSAINTVQEISGFVGHEIRSPLASLQSLFFLMEDQLQEISRLEQVTDEDWKPFVDKMGQSSALLRKVIRSTYLLGTLDMDPNTFRKNLEWVEMGKSLLVSAASAYSFEIRRKRQRVVIRRESRFAHDFVHVHRAWFEAIFDNLLGNAVKYAIEGGRIDFSILEKNGEYVIHVSNPVDNPPSPERLNRLFEKGYREDVDFDVRSIGANQGLGLYFVNRIVTLGYGGRVLVWVDEVRNTEGTEDPEDIETQVFGNPDVPATLEENPYFHIEIRIPKSALLA
ncbi:MAG: HAMP domain-containing histidine kinase [Candidatus Omnitrophica bacterium]|nr:HAMP domain-containing histidine kinase [Candidatus Omnitrophota bacterium]